MAPKHAKQDKARPSPGSAEAEGLWSREGKQARPGHWQPEAPVSRAGKETRRGSAACAGRPQGCRATSGETGPVSFEL